MSEKADYPPSDTEERVFILQAGIISGILLLLDEFSAVPSVKEKMEVLHRNFTSYQVELAKLSQEKEWLALAEICRRTQEGWR